MPANTYGRQVVIPLTNKSGGSVAAGDVVIVDTGNNDAFTTTTTAGFTGGIGIAQETIANNATGRVLISGYAALVNVSASVTRGHFGATHTVAKQAASAGASRGVGTFCQFLAGGTTPDAIMYPVDLLGSSLTNPMTTAGDVIVGGASGAPARLAADAAGKFLTAAGAGVAPTWGQGPLTTTGDVLIGATGGTPTRLALGAAGGALSRINGVVAWNSGTSNPGSAVAGDRYWRTDLGLEIYYDGTRWLTTTLYHMPLAGPMDGSSTAAENGWANPVTGRALSRMALWADDFQAYLVTLYGQTYVGTTNNGTNFWTLALSGGATSTAYGNFTTAADTANTQTRHKATLNVLAGATEGGLILTATKTLSPGSIYAPCSVSYRLVVP